MTKLELGDNLVHLLQLAILATACILLAVFTTLDKTALVALFFGSGGILSTIHLMNMNASTVAAATEVVPPTTAAKTAPESATTSVAPIEEGSVPPMTLMK